MRILYIHGFNSSVNSGTYRKLKNLFPQHEWFAENFNLTDVRETRNRIDSVISGSGIDVIIASSLGAFYALGAEAPVSRIVINPCMKPSIEIPKLDSSVPGEVIFAWKEMEKELVEADGEVGRRCFGIFGNHDELFSYRKYFGELYGETNLGVGKSFLVEGGHHSLSEDVLMEYVQKGLDYSCLVR